MAEEHCLLARRQTASGKARLRDFRRLRCGQYQMVNSGRKMAAALSLISMNYKARPARLLLIKSKNEKQRRIHVETYYGRAM